MTASASEFLVFLIERAKPSRLICIGPCEAARHAASRSAIQLVHFADVNDILRQPNPVDADLLHDAIVVALGVLDSIEQPRQLLQLLGEARRLCRFMLVDAADRARTLSFGATSDLPTPRWSAEEFFGELVGLGYPPSMPFGYVSSQPGGVKDRALAIAGMEAEFKTSPRPFRAAAILNVFNEADVIEATVEHLAVQGIEVHLIDNWSDDGTYEICERLVAAGRVSALSRFPVQKTGDYEWALQLQNAAQYAARLDVDWVIHYDADELRTSPWKGVSLFDGLRFVDGLGYNAVDFTVVDFRFVGDGPKQFSPSEFKYFEFGRHSSHFLQVKAWKNGGPPVDLVTDGGHNVKFDERRVYPLKFLTRHYSFRSRQQATDKVFRDRLPRVRKERTERGWHVHFDQFEHLESFEPWQLAELTAYDENGFWHEYLVERLSGVGIERENEPGLNRNSARTASRNQARLIGELRESVSAAGARLDELGRAVASREERVEVLARALRDKEEKIGNLEQAVAERNEHLVDLQKALTEEKQLVDELNQGMAESNRQIAGLQQSLLDGDMRIAGLTNDLYWRQKEVDDMRASDSWKFTRPLRAAAQGVRAAAMLARSASRAVTAPVKLRHGMKRAIAIMREDGMAALYRRVQLRLSRSQVAVEPNSSGPVPPTNPVAGESHMDALSRRLDGLAAYVADRLHSARRDLSQVSTYVADAESEADLSRIPVRAIAFYLPQFHPIPENDLWWGKGFTEWTNVTKAQPQFRGHYQPHLPGELGFYDLRLPQVMHRQVELARKYGISAFCFHYYWFAGKRLLAMPLDNFLADRAMEIDFCLCWANENWSRRWDGSEDDILIAQDHSPADDLAFIDEVARSFADPRYIRVDGRPVLLVYRASLLPDAQATAQRWRSRAIELGFPGLYLVAVRSFDITDPRRLGFDAAVEFPPHQGNALEVTRKHHVINPDYRGRIYDYPALAERFSRQVETRFVNFKAVMPSWDNEARKPGAGHSFVGSTPETYAAWLLAAAQATLKYRKPERLLFINAWNEWGEGAHLEPDRQYGYAYLRATRDVLASPRLEGTAGHRVVVLVSHDAYPHGAQFLALNLARTLHDDLGLTVHLVCLGEGPLKKEFAKWAVLHDLTGLSVDGPEAHALARRLHAEGARSALVNTTVSGHFLRTLTENGIDCVALIHELRAFIESRQLQKQAGTIAERASKIVFPAQEVASAFQEVAAIEGNRVVIRPQGLYKPVKAPESPSAARRKLRGMLGIPANSQVVLGVGFADHRKGVDLFVEAGVRMAHRMPLAHWLWVGHWDGEMQARIEARLGGLGDLHKRFIFAGQQSDTEPYYTGADVFALTSREDPFPSVVLEAMSAGIPVVAFEGAGGFVQLLQQGGGRLVPAADCDAFADAVADLLSDDDERRQRGLAGAKLVAEQFSFRRYAFDLLDLLRQGLPRISVVVPNFNYARYLQERLSSILAQRFPIFEVIYLDDCSTDDSVAEAEAFLRSRHVDYRIVRNSENSGSVFRQWKKGVELARGTHVWIAEADDMCRPDFLPEVMRGFENPGVVLSYCESRQIDADGAVLADNYQAYVADIDAERWTRRYVSAGAEEVRDAMCIRNTIPNVSAVVFDRHHLRSVLDEHLDFISSFKVAGDWMTYLLLLQHGKLAFSPRALNDHRRHAKGQTLASFNTSLIQEIQRGQTFAAQRFQVAPQQVLAARRYIDTLVRQFTVGGSPQPQPTNLAAALPAPAQTAAPAARAPAPDAGSDTAESKVAGSLATAAQTIATLQTQVTSLEDTVREIRSSRSWRVTAPLRLGGYALRLAARPLSTSSDGQLPAQQVEAAVQEAEASDPIEVALAEGDAAAPGPATDVPGQAPAIVDQPVEYLAELPPDFDAAYYLEMNPDVAKSDLGAEDHFRRQGFRESRLYARPDVPQEEPAEPMAELPSDFDPAYYLLMNPDVAQSTYAPEDHYRRHGFRESRLYAPMELTGHEAFSPDRETILVVSHEASRSGAPAVSLNVVQALARRYNILVMLLGDGALTEAFSAAGAAVAKCMGMRHNELAANVVIDRLTSQFHFRYALVNSIESRIVLPALGRAFVPTITLIHEFASCYPRSQEVFKLPCIWSTTTVFSSAATLADAMVEYPYLQDLSAKILPQGRCVLPVDEFSQEELEAERARLRRIMRPAAQAGTMVILGAGQVTYRKGVDLFIECAAKVSRTPGGEKCRFIWIGKGFDPDTDAAYSVYLADQIRRAGLQQNVAIVGETFAIDMAYELADVLLLTSRLDPLPNVAIDAMGESLPLLCFDKASGIADFLIEAGLRDECVAGYMDIDDMARKIVALAASPALRESTGNRCREASRDYFDMPGYVERLDALGAEAVRRCRQEKEDVQIILASGLFRPDFFSDPFGQARSAEEEVRTYVRTWASRIGLRKPFPGFHPGIYEEQHGLSAPGVDPLADYLRAGQPAGAWRYPVIEPAQAPLSELPASRRVALHVHAYFPEELEAIASRLALNRVTPDLFISVADEKSLAQVHEELKGYAGRIMDVQMVPNRGRDIGPFLSLLGRIDPAQYEYVGHLHTKKSGDIGNAAIGRLWYKFLLDNLLGGPASGAMTETILAFLGRQPSVGLAFPDDPWVVGWGSNRAVAEPIAAKMGVSYMTENFVFPVGTMFWARTCALEPLRQLNLTWDDYPPEPLPYDGTSLHALERLLPWAISAAGFRSARTNIEGLTR
jgi:O-antigen biosynthesis protein